MTAPVDAYPIANVLQSAPGAKAVIGSKIVRADICSTVDGSKRMTFPCELPIQQRLAMK